MKEIVKALVFLVVGMALFFVPILYKNQWEVRWNGKIINLIGE